MMLAQPPRKAHWLQPFWDGIGRGILMLPRCSKCGAWEWYPHEAGPSCPGAEFIWSQVSARATVFTFTRVERPLLAGVRESYITGLVCPLDAPACRVAAHIVVDDGASLRIGAEVELRTSDVLPGPAYWYEVREHQ